MVLLGDSRVPLNCAVLMDRVWLSTAHNTRVTDYSGATVPGLHRLPHPSRRVSIIRSGAQRCQTYAGAAGLFGAKGLLRNNRIGWFFECRGFRRGLWVA